MRLNGERFFAACDCFFQSFQIGQDDSAIIVRPKIIGRERERPIVALQCLLGLPKSPQNIAAIIPARRQSRIERQRPVITGQCILAANPAMLAKYRGYISIPDC